MAQDAAILFEPEHPKPRETNEELGSLDLTTQYNQRTGRPVRTTAGRRSLDPGYMDTTEVIQDEDDDDSDDLFDDDEDVIKKKRKKLQLSSRKRKRLLSLPPPPLSDGASDDFPTRENSPVFSVATPGDTTNIVAEPMMEPVNLTFNIPLGFHGPLRVQIDPSFFQQLSKHTKLGQSAASRLTIGPVQSNAVVKRKTGFLDLAAELRNQVYRFTFVKDTPVEISRPKSLPRGAALLRACRQIYNEGRSILYGENIFHFDRDRTTRRKRWGNTSKEVGFKDIRLFLVTIGPHNISMLRDVSIEFEDCHPRDMPLLSTEERRYVHDGNVIECLKMLGRHAEVQSLHLGFYGRRTLAWTDLHFLEHLCMIKADVVTIQKPHPSLSHSHSWYYSINRINSDVRTEIIKKITRKIKLYPEATESKKSTAASRN